jgi:hypothetical protein
MNVKPELIRPGMPQHLLLEAALKLKSSRVLGDDALKRLRRWLQQLPNPEPDFVRALEEL